MRSSGASAYGYARDLEQKTLMLFYEGGYNLGLRENDDVYARICIYSRASGERTMSAVYASRLNGVLRLCDAR